VKGDVIMKLIERFESSFDKQENGCWLWKEKLDRGYGKFRIGSFLYPAHRFSYWIYRENPGDLYVCHKCDIKNCVNPEHLFLGTAQDNINDAINKKIFACGERKKNAKLSDEIVKSILKLHSEGKYTRKQLATLFNQGYSSVVDVIAGKSWKHISNPSGSKIEIPNIILGNEILIDEIYSSINIINDCWIWNKKKRIDPRYPNRFDYGIILIGSEEIAAHRLSYDLFINDIEEDKNIICHRCDVPSCINPNHLFAGTQKENIQDAVSKGRMARGEKNGQVKLKEKEVIEIKKLLKLGGHHQEIADKFNVSRRAIYGIAVGRNWAWLK
jgi:hypothetical protein